MVISGNYTKVRNDVLVALINSSLSGAEIKLTLAIVRLTWGYNKPSAEIKTNQLKELLPRMNDSRISKVKRMLAERKIISVVVQKDNKNRKNISINTDISEWRELSKKTINENSCPKGQIKLSKKTIPSCEYSSEVFKENLKEKKLMYAFRFDDIDFKLATLLRTLILENKPDRKIEGKIEAWANEIRLMRERDKRDPEAIRAVIEWSQQDGFWWKNILSTAKLRKQFDKLQDKMNGCKASPKPKPETTDTWDGVPVVQPLEAMNDSTLTEAERERKQKALERAQEIEKTRAACEWRG